MQERRRSTRISSVLPVTLNGIDMEGRGFREVACTTSFSKHGAKVSTFRKLSKGDTLTIFSRSSGEPTESRVVWASEMGKGFIIGIELGQPKNVWGIDAPPDDWKERTAPEAAPAGKTAASSPAPPASPPDSPGKEGSRAGATLPPATGNPAAASASLPGQIADGRGELEQLFERTKQALSVTAETLKVYQALESESARLVTETYKRIHSKVAAELERSFAEAVDAFSVHATEVLKKTRDDLTRMQEEHAGRIEQMVCNLEERLKAKAQAILEESQKQMETRARSIAESNATRAEAAARTVQDGAERTKKEIDEHLHQAREAIRQQAQEEVAAALSACREGSHSLLQDVRDRLLEAARGLKVDGVPAAEPHTDAIGQPAHSLR